MVLVKVRVTGLPDWDPEVAYERAAERLQSLGNVAKGQGGESLISFDNNRRELTVAYSDEDTAILAKSLFDGQSFYGHKMKVEMERQ
mmetsp:Transcript_17544/g.43725  ORF Transcript_17544/g.43725 Transcript_17544/m.43725 type:complete len:87 (-) Transcript_17544:347-607(-)|eukprot:CAMPEP_0113884416 /NCGR_PEP_ID=MMETSP0780_2-20120614/10252_1 /TAXON_ID=652834 /ORGANISM="Palpitomonas bilix" /LENGTH=86 /DNA_ID=CAMNT_0000872047 /DNA_START=73 /DNA_END=333 /DNA_ORIENTATION=+ /assembly_acc=CAM_ASM_000599